MHEKIVWTIGHSTHPIENFIELLKGYGIDSLVDIRRFPGSRRYPQYNKESLMRTLTEAGIRYIHMEGLGGRRSTHAGSRNTGWRNTSFRGYADYMETEPFHEQILQLESLATAHRLAYMCSESVWWSCHRALVSDYLKNRGWNVYHIMSLTKSELHPWTSPARIENGKLVYKPEGTLDL